MNNVPSFEQPYRYVSEATWLPSYIGLGAIAVGAIPSAWLATLVVFAGLIFFRMVLEVIYRFAFGDARLQLGPQLIAFTAQLVLWAGILWWYWKIAPAT